MASPDQRLNLYEEPDVYRLLIGDDVYHIDMPIGFDGVTFTIERDENYHGLNYEYNDGQIELKFDEAAGMSLLVEQYNKDGNDAMVRFQFGRYVDGLFSIDIDTWVDFNTYKLTRDTVSVSVKRKTFNDALEVNNEKVVSLNNYFPLPLHSQRIRRRLEYNSTAYQTGSINFSVGEERRLEYRPVPGTDSPIVPAGIFGFLDFSKAQANDLAKNPPGFGVQASEPINNKNYLFVTDGGGPFSFNIRFNVFFRAKMNQNKYGTDKPELKNWSYQWFLVIVRGGTQEVKEFTGTQTGYTRDRGIDLRGEFSLSYNTTLLQDDQVYLFGRFLAHATGSLMSFESQLDVVNANINITGDTLARTSDTPAKLVYEVGQEILDDISNGQAKLKSNLLGRTDIGYPEDGCAALIAYTNGYLVRGFKPENRPLQITLKDWLEGLNALYAIGLSYELNDDGTYSVRLEQQEYFYNDVPLMVFTDVSKYEEAIDTKRIYNTVDMGYEKYPTDDVSTLDEFNTRHVYNTPIQSLKGKFTQTCPQIASGYALELTRRQKFAETPQDSTKYDEDNFILAIRRGNLSLEPERTEDYTATGIVAGDTVYNLRFSITRNLNRWGLWLNASWLYKPLSARLENTYTAKNGDLTSRYIGSNPCESTREYKEANDLFLSDIQDGRKLFAPENITFEAKVNWQTLRALRAAHQGADPDGKSYGYIQVVDPDGELKAGWLKSLSYNPLSELTTFVLYKKYIPLHQPFECTDYSGYTFGQFEAATGLPADIEQCKFINFA